MTVTVQGVASDVYVPGGVSTGGSDFAAFVAALQAVAQIRALWVPRSTDTTTTTTPGPSPKTFTYDATIAARFTAQGSGQLVTFDGAANYATTPDNTDCTFGDGAVDSPFSVVVLANVTNTAAARVFLSKWASGGSNREWEFGFQGDDTLALQQRDEAAAKTVTRVSNAAAGMGALRLFGCTSPGVGGAAAMTTAVLYQDAAVVASTATNDAAYVAMADKAAAVEVGSDTAHTASFMQGSLGFACLFAAALTLAQHVAVKAAVNTYFGLSL